MAAARESGHDDGTMRASSVARTPPVSREGPNTGRAPWETVRDALLVPVEFVVDAAGDVPPDAAQFPAAWHGGRYAGAWFLDARVLSHYELRCNGRRLRLLETQQLGSRGVRHRLAIPDCDELVVFRHQLLDGPITDEISVLNLGDTPAAASFELLLDADFADLLEPDAERTGSIARTIEGPRLTLTYRRDGFVRGLRATVSEPRAATSERGFAVVVTVPPHGARRVTWTLQPFSEDRGAPDPAPAIAHLSGEVADEAEWLAQWPRLESDPPTLARLYDGSLRNLYRLRLGLQGEDLELFGAGRPAFLALFGRDSLIIALAALPFRSRPARDALRIFARLQGRRTDPWTEEQPGRIVHELRIGESGRFGLRPPVDFGTVDAPALYVTLLDEYVAATGDTRLAGQLEAPARAALTWLSDIADRDGDAFIEYQRTNTRTGLINQTWKDSDDSMAFPDGSLAQPPIAAAEVQGYAYDAYRRGARLARTVWHDPALARDLVARADRLRARFDQVFWLPDEATFGMALDGDKRVVPTRCSSLGHLLASGIVRRERYQDVADTLLGPALFSGWGVRTIAADVPAYDPIGYHRGTIWPHDTAIAVLGLARAGHRHAALHVLDALLAASVGFGFRLPELFAGFRREDFPIPVEYPDAARPLGMASAAVLILLRVLFGPALGRDAAEIRPGLPQLAAARLRWSWA